MLTQIVCDSVYTVAFKPSNRHNQASVKVMQVEPKFGSPSLLGSNYIECVPRFTKPTPTTADEEPCQAHRFQAPHWPLTSEQGVNLPCPFYSPTATASSLSALSYSCLVRNSEKVRSRHCSHAY